MRYKFLKSVQIGHTDYLMGHHEICEEVENHPHFLKCVGLGIITDADIVDVVVVENIHERAKLILSRLEQKRQPKKEECPEPKEEPCEEDFLAKPKKKSKKSE